MAINDTPALGPPTGRSAARRRRTLTGPAGTSVPAPPCPADVDATPLHPLVAERAAPAPALVDGAGESSLGQVAAPAAPAPHQALLALLEAHNAVATESSVPRVLQRVVEGAREITGARYAALTLCTPDGSPGTRVESGSREEALSEVSSSSPDPSGSAAPERSPRSAEQRPSPARPSGRSRYRSFRVPVAARGSVLGHLQVSGPPAGRVFSADDEDLVTALAMTAGIAVLNLRCSDERQHRREPPSEPGNGAGSQGQRVAGDDERADLRHGLPSRVVRGLSALALALRGAGVARPGRTAPPAQPERVSRPR